MTERNTCWEILGSCVATTTPVTHEKPASAGPKLAEAARAAVEPLEGRRLFAGIDVDLVNAPSGTHGGDSYFLLQAKTSGDVDRVEYFADGKSLGSASGAPWMVSWRDVDPGSYDVTAKAYGDGDSKTSDKSSVKVVETTGRTWHVAKDGNDGDAGSSSSPLRTIKTAIAKAKPGDTVRIGAGTYKEAIRVKNSGTQEKPITIEAAEKGKVTIDADNKGYVFTNDYPGSGKHLTIKGINFRNAANKPGQNLAAVRTTDGWTMIDCKVEDVDGAGVGVFGKNVVLHRVTARDNGCTGIGGSGFSGGMILDSTSEGNNTKKYSGSYEGGGGKFTRVKSLLVEDHEASDNNGPGIWFDGDNINITIRDSVFHDNHNLKRDDGTESIGGRGIQLEISGIDSDGNGGIEGQGPILIEDCLTYDNDNASVQVYSTSNVTLKNNTFVNDYIDLKDKRPKPWITKKLTITGNKLKDAGIVADSHTVDDWRDRDFKINGNTYDTDGALIRWDGKSYNSISAVRSGLGFESGGKTGSVPYSKV